MILTIIVVLAVLLMIFLTEVENFGWATALLLVGAVVAHFTHVVDLLDLVKFHLTELLVYTGCYLAAGVVWSFAKWFSHLHRAKEDFLEYRVRWLSEQKLFVKEEALLDVNGAVPENLLPKFKVSLTSSGRGIPQASQNKARITAWMAFWPTSLIGTLINDPVRRLFKFLFNTFKGQYQRIANRVFRDIKELQA